MRHFINSQDFLRADYDEVLRRTEEFLTKGISPDLARGKVVATLFFQPSTRTMNAFQSAMIRAGGGWIGVMGEKGLSMEKGESFEDTIRTYGSFADCIALRHPDDDSAERAAAVSLVPVINAGSGSREHAVATPMILANITHYLGRPITTAKIGIYGTPEINRVTKAMVPIFGMYNVDLFIDDLGHFPLPKKIEEQAKAHGLRSLQYEKLERWIGDVDVLFVTRGLQKGIIPEGKFPKEKEELILKSYKPITTEHMKKLRKDAVLYMITPRIFEVDRAVDSDPRALYAQYEPYREGVLAVMTYLLGIPVE